MSGAYCAMAFRLVVHGHGYLPSMPSGSGGSPVGLRSLSRSRTFRVILTAAGLKIGSSLRIAKRSGP